MHLALIALALAGSHQDPPTLVSAATFTAAPFSRIRGIVERTDGTVIVVDQTEKALYRVDLARGVRTQIGRTGAGPDEYDGLTGIGPWRADSLLVTDLGNGRLAVLGPDLTMGRTLPMFGPGYGIPQGSDEQGRMYFDRVTSVRLARREDRAASDLAAVVRLDALAARGDTIARVRVPGDANPGPFRSWDVWAVGADGRVAIVRNQDEYRLDWVLQDGREIHGAVIAESRIALTERDRALWQERNPRGGSRVSMGGQPAGPPSPPEFPDRFPYAKGQGVWVDAQGRAWVERHQPLSEARALLDVFDREGARIASVRLPAGRRVIGFGAGGLWAVRVDEVDLQWLERYEVAELPSRTGGRR